MLLNSKYAVWALLAVPFAWICAGFASDTIGYGQVLHQTGLWSSGLLLAGLSITPLRKLFGSGRSLPWLLRQRRAIGVASFAYAALHTAVYLERKWGADLILREGLAAPLGTGWLALAVFFALAVTSNNTSVRKMGRSWKRLHRTVYIATVLIFAHWWLTTFDATTAYVFAGILLVVQLLRFKSR